jgi:nucleoside-diphosphate-sugar epimerase
MAVNSRRTFLKTLATSGVAANALLAADRPAQSTKTVLVAGPESPLVNEIRGSLAPAYPVRHVGFPAWTQSDVREQLKGVQALVLSVGQGHPTPLAERIDVCTRAVYELLQAAVAENVGQVVFLSSLAMMSAYGEGLLVDEDWRPRPGDGESLPEYLGEFVCREFAREGKLGVIVLRLGELLLPDAARAVRLALDAQLAGERPRLGPWSLVHIHSGATPWLPLRKAEKLLGYRPGGTTR